MLISLQSTMELITTTPALIWNQVLRTNHHLEGWHYLLNRLARNKHPNLFEVIELIKKEQYKLQQKCR